MDEIKPVVTLSLNLLMNRGGLHTEKRVDFSSGNAKKPAYKIHKDEGWKWIDWAPVMVSFLALLITVFATLYARDAKNQAVKSNEQYREELTLTHRPYVWAENHGYLTNDNILINDFATLRLIVINSPARIVFEQHTHFMVKETEKIEITKYISLPRILYPTDKVQYTHSIGQIDVNKIESYLINGYQAFRTSKVSYEMLSNNNVKYFYEVTWKFNQKNRSWDVDEPPKAN